MILFIDQFLIPHMALWLYDANILKVRYLIGSQCELRKMVLHSDWQIWQSWYLTYDTQECRAQKMDILPNISASFTHSLLSCWLVLQTYTTQEPKTSLMSLHQCPSSRPPSLLRPRPFLRSSSSRASGAFSSRSSTYSRSVRYAHGCLIRLWANGHMNTMNV